MSKQLQKRNAVLSSAETRLRNLVKDIKNELWLANSDVFGPGAQAEGDSCTQSQLFQLLQDRLQEVGTKCGGVHRY